MHSSSVIAIWTDATVFIDLEAGRSVKPGDTVKIRYKKVCKMSEKTNLSVGILAGNRSSGINQAKSEGRQQVC